MLTLALTFCLGLSCRTLHPGEPMPPAACLVAGQWAAAQLLATDPTLQGWRLRDVRCEPSGRRERA